MIEVVRLETVLLESRCFFLIYKALFWLIVVELVLVVDREGRLVASETFRHFIIISYFSNG